MSRRPPLHGLVIVDFTRVLAGPFCTMLLADMGADVIKVERPDGGDDTRSWGPPFVGGDATYFLSVNRDKRSIVLDLADPRDRAEARRLVSTADVVVENFRSGVMSRFGLDYQSLRSDNARLIYCSIPAFASTPVPIPGYDLLMQAACGFMSLTGNTEPVKTGVAILDVVTGLYATTGILAALAARQDTGVGQHVTVGLFEASLSALVNQASSYLMGGVVPGLAGNEHPSIVPYQAFDAADGKFVLAAGNDKLFRTAVALVGAPELADDHRFRTNSHRVAHRAELAGRLSVVFQTQPAEHWVRLFTDHGVPASAVRTLDQVFASHEAVESLVEIADSGRGALRYVRTPISLSETPLHPPRIRPPSLGEHSSEIRRDQSPDGPERRESDA